MFYFQFYELFVKIRPYIESQTTQLCKPISAEEKLAVTLRFLATVETFRSLMYQFRIRHSTITKFILQVLHAIYIVLKDDYLQWSTSQEDWTELVEQT